MGLPFIITSAPGGNGFGCSLDWYSLHQEGLSVFSQSCPDCFEQWPCNKYSQGNDVQDGALGGGHHSAGPDSNLRDKKGKR